MTERRDDAPASARRASGGAEGPHGAEGRELDEAPGEVYYCDLCGNVMLNLHCKLVCGRCGYRRDCSDP